MPDKLPPKKIDDWWPIYQNDNTGGLPDSIPNYRCRGCLAILFYVVPVAVFAFGARWYYHALQQAGMAAGIAPVDAQFTGLIVSALITAVGVFLGIVGAFWVLIGRSRVLKYVCREML